MVSKPLCSDIHAEAEKSERKQVSGKKDVLGSGVSKGLSVPECTHCRCKQSPRGGRIKRTGVFEHLFRAGGEADLYQRGWPRPAGCGE